MRLLLVALLAGMALAAPAFAQAMTCDIALKNLNNARDGKGALRGLDPGETPLKPAGSGYKGANDAPMFAIDAYREHGDVRANCPEQKWPPSVKPEGLKAAMLQGIQQNPEMFCGGKNLTGQPRAPVLLRSIVSVATFTQFSDRAAELQDKLVVAETGTARQTVARHLSDHQWLFEAADILGESCPEGEMYLDAYSARTGVNMAYRAAKDNAAFMACVKGRAGWRPQLQAFDAALSSGDLARAEKAYADLEVAAQPGRQACEASEEGKRDVEYILASKKLQLKFGVPGCADAARAMQTIQQKFNGTPRDILPMYVKELRDAAANAATVCQEPAAATWGNFVAWITEQNYFRVK